MAWFKNMAFRASGVLIIRYFYTKYFYLPVNRKILLLTAIAAWAFGANAQRVNFNVGGGLSSHYGGSTLNIGAFKLGVSYEHEIPGNFSIEPGVYFYAKGYKDKNESVFMRDDKGEIVKDENGDPMMGVKNVTTSKYYIEVPVLANYYLEISPMHYIEFSAGPYAAVGVGGKRKTRGDTEQDIQNRFYYEKSTFKEEGVKRFDCGITAGIAYEFNRIFAVGAQADFGMLNFRKQGGKNNSGLITFSYRLRLDN